MEVTRIGEDFLEMKMPARPTNMQPFGIMHGGAVAALAENVGSLASHLILHPDKGAAGLTLTCNHLKSTREGFLTAIAKAKHIGRSSHVWEIEVRNGKEELTNLCVLTMAVIDLKK